mgnify:CR=1 FL=1
MTTISSQKIMEKVVSLNFSESELRGKTMQSVTARCCPWCGRLWKLNINLEKGVFRCPACDESGNAVKLHAKLQDISYEQAKDELFKDNSKPKKIIKLETVENIELASLARRDMVYRSIIKHGICSGDQYNDLIRRGLDDDQVRNYVTVISGMNNSAKTWCKELKNVLLENETQIKGVPGIYGKASKDEYGNEIKDDLVLNLPKYAGYLIPVITHRQNKPAISCFQIRHFSGTPRYSFFTSSGLENGVSVSGCNKVHYTRNFWDKEGKMIIPETVNLTEGALKADVAAYLSGRQFIAILGVNDIKDLKHELMFLKKGGCKNINICFDMDYQTNPNVAKALRKLQALIAEAGLNIRNITWDKTYKGIDDYLLAAKKAKQSSQKCH